MSLPRRDPAVLLPDDALVAYANMLLVSATLLTRVTAVRERAPEHIGYEGRAPDGLPIRVIAPMFVITGGCITFRSLLRIIDPDRPAKWLEEGQASRNAKELLFLGTQGPKLVTSRDNYANWVRSGYEEGITNVRRAYFESEIADGLSLGLFGDEVEVITAHGRHPLPEAVSEPVFSP